jgi:hypothetical protein
MAPVYTVTVDAVVLGAEQEPPRIDPVPVADPEQAGAADAVFSQPSQEENHLVAGLIGLWTSSLLLHDLAIEHFDTEEEEVPPALRQEKKKKR